MEQTAQILYIETLTTRKLSFLMWLHKLLIGGLGLSEFQCERNYFLAIRQSRNWTVVRWVEADFAIAIHSTRDGDCCET